MIRGPVGPLGGPQIKKCVRKKEFNLSLKKEKSNVAIASAITSKARIKLHKAQNDVIKNKGRLLYSDTDSIFAAYKTNVDNQIHGSIFWDCSKNDTKIKKAFFANPKTYGLIYHDNREIVKMKGYNQINLLNGPITLEKHNESLPI